MAKRGAIEGDLGFSTEGTEEDDPLEARVLGKHRYEIQFDNGDLEQDVPNHDVFPCPVVAEVKASAAPAAHTRAVRTTPPWGRVRMRFGVIFWPRSSLPSNKIYRSVLLIPIRIF